MERYRHINIIRKPNGKLRNWKEYNILAKYERNCDVADYNFPCDEARDIKNNEERERVQKRVQKIGETP